jgi:hypothetical protein
VLPVSIGATRTLTLSTSKLFVPLSSISDVVVNEGIWRWQIIYYLVIIRNEDSASEAKLEIGFKVSARVLGQARTARSESILETALMTGTLACHQRWLQELLPRLAQVRQVWSGIRQTLFDELSEVPVKSENCQDA